MVDDLVALGKAFGFTVTSKRENVPRRLFLTGGEKFNFKWGSWRNVAVTGTFNGLYFTFSSYIKYFHY